MTHDDVQGWLDRYVAAWDTYDPAAIGDLFADEAEYRYQPWAEPVVGRDAIVAELAREQGRARLVGRALRRLGVRRRAGVGDRREPLHEPRWLVPDALLQPLRAPLRRPRQVRRVRRVLHGAPREAPTDQLRAGRPPAIANGPLTRVGILSGRWHERSWSSTTSRPCARRSSRRSNRMDSGSWRPPMAARR